MYGFGYYESDLLNNLKIKYNKYFPCGSMRYGIYKKFFSEKINKKSKNLVFISQWRNNNNDVKNKKNLNILLKALKKFAVEYNLDLKILPSSFIKTSEFEEEVKFYKYYFQEINHDNFLEKNSFIDAYKYTESSKLIASYSSTLAFEMYGVGVKTLFLGCSLDYENESNYLFKGCFRKVNSINKVNKIDNKELHLKLLYLLKLNTEEYLNITKNNRDYYYTKNKLYVHEIIKDRINKLIDS